MYIRYKLDVLQKVLNEVLVVLRHLLRRICSELPGLCFEAKKKGKVTIAEDPWKVSEPLF